MNPGRHSNSNCSLSITWEKAPGVSLIHIANFPVDNSFVDPMHASLKTDFSWDLGDICQIPSKITVDKVVVWRRCRQLQQKVRTHFDIFDT